MSKKIDGCPGIDGTKGNPLWDQVKRDIPTNTCELEDLKSENARLRSEVDTKRMKQRKSGYFVYSTGNYVGTFRPIPIIGRWLKIYRLTWRYHD